MRSDGKGFMFGLSLGLAVVAGFGAAQLASGREGRFLLESSAGSGHLHTYLTDTTNGTVWELQGNVFRLIGSPKAE